MTDRNDPIWNDTSAPEPPPGSVIMLEGLTGTAWQRFHSDGLWHRPDHVGGYEWETVMWGKKGFHVLYVAPQRPEKRSSRLTCGTHGCRFSVALEPVDLETIQDAVDEMYMHSRVVHSYYDNTLRGDTP